MVRTCVGMHNRAPIKTQPANKSPSFLRTPETRVRLRKIAAYFVLHGCNPVLSEKETVTSAPGIYPLNDSLIVFLGASCEASVPNLPTRPFGL